MIVLVHIASIGFHTYPITNFNGHIGPYYTHIEDPTKFSNQKCKMQGFPFLLVVE